jgi:hypothetical protein
MYYKLNQDIVERYKENWIIQRCWSKVIKDGTILFKENKFKDKMNEYWHVLSPRYLETHVVIDFGQPDGAILVFDKKYLSPTGPKTFKDLLSIKEITFYDE